MKRFRLLPPLLAVIALTVSACGGSDDGASSGGSGSGGDAAALIKDTFGTGHAIRSGRLDATLDVDLKGWAVLGTPLDLHLNGPFQSNGGTKLPDFALDVDFGGEQPVTIGAVFAQGGGYLSIEGQAFDLGKSTYAAFRKGYENAKKDAAGKGKKDTTTLSALGVAPIRWLKDPKKVGEEDVAGTSTVHLTSGVDVPKLLTDLSTLLDKAKSVTSAGSAATGAAVPTRLSPRQRELIQKSVRSAKVDVWTGAKDHTLRKVAVDIQVDVPDDLKDQANGLTTGHVRFAISIAQLNQAQKIAKPGDARPLSELRSVLAQSGLTGGDAGASSSESSSAPSETDSGTATTQAPATDPQSEYQQCLAGAGNDLAKVQDCAQYLNK